MSNIIPVNDHLLVEIGSAAQKIGGLETMVQSQQQEGWDTGIVVAVSEFMTYFGFQTYAFDSSMMNAELLGQVKSMYKAMVGKKVYWPKMAERGMTIKHEGKEYALIKMTALMAVEEGDK